MDAHQQGQPQTLPTLVKAAESQQSPRVVVGGPQGESPSTPATIKPQLARKINRTHMHVRALGKRAEEAARAGGRRLALLNGERAFKQARLNAERMRDIHIEPSRSKLHLVAAAFALDVERYTVALDLVARALEGNPPAEVAQDLEQLRQVAMRGRIYATGGEGDTGHGVSQETAQGGDSSPEPGPETDMGTEPGDCTGCEPEPEHSEPIPAGAVHG